MIGADLIYNTTRYDYDPAAADSGNPPRQLSRPATVITLLRTPYRAVEVAEPAVVDRWLDLFAQITAIRIRSLVSWRRTRIVAYCIGIADPQFEVMARWRFPRRVAKWITWLALNVLVRMTDRLAFGTTGSMQMYESYVGTRALTGARVFEAIPAPCPCLATSAEVRLPRLLFVGALEERKGITALMDAWEIVRSDNADLPSLAIIGKGSLSDEVQLWAADKPEVEVLIDPPREAIHHALRTSAALVLLSQPWRHWREQIGLPILEGLSHGCEILTTTETGLAHWLEANSHTVLDPASRPSDVARAIVDTLMRATTRRGSLDALASQDQRLAADHWLMGPTG